MLGLTGHVDDENPLWVTLDTSNGRIRHIGGRQRQSRDGRALLAAGQNERRESEEATSTRLRDYLGALVAEGQPVYGVVLPCVFDIDRARDVAAAEGGGLRPSARERPSHETMAKTCRGIYREPDHSPGRIDDDRAIMDCVGEALTSRGFNVELVEVDAAFDGRCANLFAMCERGTVLDRLTDGQNAGSVVVNSPNAIRNTYRHRMVELFARHHVASPASQVVASNAKGPPPAAAVWVKRYDFHATQPSDVIYTASEAGWHEALDRFAKRGIPFIIAQEHVSGDLVKFYGVRGEMRPRSCQLVRMVLSSRQGNAGSFLRGRAPARRGVRCCGRSGTGGFWRRCRHPGRRQTDDHRHQRLAKLCPVPRACRSGDRKSPGGAFRAAHAYRIPTRS